MKKLVCALGAAIVVAGLSMTATAATAVAASCPALNAVDPDNDGHMTLREAKKAAKAAFKRMNPDKDRTLDRAEVGGRISNAAFAAADPDKDGTLSKGEWMRLVKMRFRRANTDGDRTIECDELHTRAGHALYNVLR
jgi:Ca2+-binding EF-hand superfamily protein